MNLAEFDYHLPAELIAQEPLEDRAASRMLVVYRDGQRWEDRAFRDFPQFLRAGDCVVFNDSRVFPARLLGQRPRRGAARYFYFERSPRTAATGRRWSGRAARCAIGERIEFLSALGPR